MKKPFRWPAFVLCVACVIAGAAVLRTKSLRKSEKIPGTSPLVEAMNAAAAVRKTAGATLRSEPISTNRIPLSALEQVLQSLSSDTIERKPQIDNIVENATSAERVKMLDQLWSEDMSGARRELASELLQKWAQEMPEAAAEWLGAKPAGSFHQEASRSVAIIWANQNLNEAAEWVRRWPEDQKDAGLIAVAYEAARTSPKDALWLASELAPTPARDGLIAHAVREWAAGDAGAPVNWAEKMEPSALREQVFANAAVSLSELDPAAAATLALQKLPPGGRQDDAVVSIIQRWVQTNPTEAADWVARFPQGRLREAAVENLVQIWAEKTPDKPAEWLNGLDEGPLKDSAIAAYARQLAPSSPDAALAWAERISEEEFRAREIDHLSRTLLTGRKATNAAPD